MDRKTVQFRGDAPPQSRRPVTNRTAAVLKTAYVAVLDQVLADAASTSVGLGFSNVVAPAAGNIACKAVVYDGKADIADDVDCDVVTSGIVAAQVNGLVAKGDKLELIAAQNYFKTITGAGNHTIQAIALEANAAGTATKLVRLLEEQSETYRVA